MYICRVDKLLHPPFTGNRRRDYKVLQTTTQIESQYYAATPTTLLHGKVLHGCGTNMPLIGFFPFVLRFLSGNG